MTEQNDLSGGQLTWTEFRNCCKNIVNTSNRIGDNWKWINNKNVKSFQIDKKNEKEAFCKTENQQDEDEDESSSYLYKLLKKSIKLNVNKSLPNELITKLLTFDYHIVYSISYSVPILYFNIYNNDGSLLDLTDVWDIFNYNYKNNEPNLLSILTQMEHPILFKPFFALHPCKTELFLAEIKGSKNKVLTYLSTVGPTVCLDMNLEYGII